MPCMCRGDVDGGTYVRCCMLIFWYRTEHMFKGYGTEGIQFQIRLNVDWMNLVLAFLDAGWTFSGLYIQIKCYSDWTLYDFMALIERLRNMQINKLYYGPFKVVTNRWVCDNQICALLYSMHARIPQKSTYSGMKRLEFDMRAFLGVFVVRIDEIWIFFGISST